MKKLSYILASAIVAPLLAVGVASCGDNTDFSKAHILTDEEMSELARQKHIADSLAQVINADAIQYVEVEDYVAPDGIWSSKTFEIDTKLMAETFEMTEDEVLAALCQAPGAAEFTNVVIQGTTHMDQSTNNNNRTNGLWGHWFKYNGNATEAGYSEADSRFYTEWAGYYDEEEGTCVDPFFNIGQFPGRSAAGDKYQAIECFIYCDKRMAVVIAYSIIERQAVTGGVVATHDLSMNCEYNTGYATSSVEFDLNGLLAELGASSWSDITWVGINSDGSYNQVYNAGDAVGNQGFWYDQSGYPGSWGEEASVFACFPTDVETNTFTVAPMPDAFTPGMSVTIHFAAVCGDNIVEYHLTVNVVSAAAIVGDVVYTKEYTVKQMFRNDYSYSLLPVEADAICSALGIDNLGDAIGLTKDETGAYTKDYCADGQGFWYRADGTLGYGDATIYIARILTNDTSSDDYANLRIGMMPGDDASHLEPITVMYAYMANGKIAELTINWSVGDADEGFAAATDWASEIAKAQNVGNLVLSAECPWNNGFEGALIEFDANAVKAALGVDDLSGVIRYAQQPDGLVIYQGDDPAYWYGADGTVSGYGPDGRIFCAYYGYDPEYPEDEYTLYTGLMPIWENEYTCRVGDEYRIIYGLYRDGKSYTFTIKATVTGEEEEIPAPAEAPARKVNLKKVAHRNR